MDKNLREGYELTRRKFLRVSGGALFGAWALGLTGCGNDESTAGAQQTLKFANWVSAEEATREKIQKVIKAFDGADVNSMSIPYDQVRQQLLTQTAAGTPPDVMQLSGPWSQELGAQGTLLDLRQLAGESYLNDNYKGALEAGTYNGKLYAAPLSLTPQGFWYDKELMSQAGLDPEAPPKTMDELNEQMAQIKSELGSEGVFPIGLDTTKLSVALLGFWPWFYAHNARPLYDGAVFDTPQVGDALQWLRDAVENEYTPVGQQIKELRELQAKQKIVFRMDSAFWVGIGRSLNADLEGDAFYDRYAVTTVPVGANGESETVANLHQLGISSEVEDEELAWDFVKYLVSSDVSINEYQTPLGVLPALKSDQKGKAVADPVNQAFAEEIVPTMVPGPYGPEYGQAEQIVVNALQRTAVTDTPIDQIMQSTEQELQLVYSG